MEGENKDFIWDVCASPPFFFQSSFNLFSPGMSVLKGCFTISIGCKSPFINLIWEKMLLLGRCAGGKDTQENAYDCKSLRVTLTLLFLSS